MTSVLAVYENGVLRPKQPLALTEGQTVEVTIAPAATLTIQEWERRMREAKSIQEWVQVANSCPEPDSDLDIVKLINESRRLTGFRVPAPEPTAEIPA